MELLSTYFPFFSYFENGGGWLDSEQRLFQVGRTVIVVGWLIFFNFFSSYFSTVFASQEYNE